MLNAAARSKLIYLALAAALLLPLVWLGQPASRTADKLHPGGILAQQRQQYRLSQANLGKIDPASETIKLATLGMRSIAANLLWHQAEEYKLKKDWTRLSAVYQQIAYLQPNFVEVWRFQAWNLSHNIAAEWDDYRQRYQYTLRGIDFLQQGLEYNEDDPRLLMTIGWFALHRVGRSDERRQFRQMFREDDDFHRRQVVHERDNFLYARDYYRLSEQAVEHPHDDSRLVQVSVSPPLFFSRAAMAQAGYAAALEDDHALALEAVAQKGFTSLPRREAWNDYETRFAEIDVEMTARILAAWQQFARQWRDLAARKFIAPSGVPYYMQDLERADRERKAAAARLDALLPGMREKIRQEKIAQLPEDIRRAFDKLPGLRTQKEQELAAQAIGPIFVYHDDLVERADAAQRADARKLADEANRLDAWYDAISSNRETVNFNYWAERAVLEQETEARLARQHVHRATVAYHDADLVRARSLYDRSFAEWRKVIDRHPVLTDDPTGLLMIDAIHQYEHTLDQLDEPFPKDFILDNLRKSIMAQ
jgi:hypothetical protein